MEKDNKTVCPFEKDNTKLLVKTAWQNALDSIYTEDINEFKSLLTDDSSIMSTPDGPWYLIHHLFSNKWEIGIELYKELGGSVEYETLDYCVSLNKSPLFIIGGQSILHILAKSSKSKELLEKSISIYPHLNQPDFNGNMPMDLLDQPNDIFQFRLQLKKVQARLFIDLSAVQSSPVEIKETLHDGIQLFSVNPEICAVLMRQINDIENQIPNSMHRYCFIFLYMYIVPVLM